MFEWCRLKHADRGDALESARIPEGDVALDSERKSNFRQLWKIDFSDSHIFFDDQRASTFGLRKTSRRSEGQNCGRGKKSLSDNFALVNIMRSETGHKVAPARPRIIIVNTNLIAASGRAKRFEIRQPYALECWISRYRRARACDSL